MRKRIGEGAAAVIISIPVAILTVSAPYLSVIMFMFILSWLISRFRLHYYIMALIALFLPFSFEILISPGTFLLVPTEPLIIVVLLTVIWDILYDPVLLRKLFQLESKWILPLMIWFVITLLFSTMKLVSVKFSLVNITYILVFFLFYKHMFNRWQGKFVILVSLYSLSLAAVFLYSIWQYHEYEFNPVTVRGIFAPFYKDHTIFGASAAMISVFWLSKGIHERSHILKILSILAGSFFLAAVFISHSRAAILSIGFFAVIYTLIALKVRLRIIAAFLILTALFLFIMRGNIMIKASGDVSNMERLNRWTAGLAMAAEKPITGFGPGTYQFEYIPYQRPEFRNRLTVDDPWHIPENSGGTAHSEYILALSEMGFPGLIFLLIFLGRILYVAFEKRLSIPNRTTIIIVMCALSTYMFHAFFNNFLNTDKIAFLFWGFSAWIFSAYERELL